MLRHHRRNDACDENHDDNTIQHLVVHQIHPWGHFQLHTHHHHGNGTGSMGTSQSEHHITCRLRQSEQQARQVGCHSLAEGSKEDYQSDDK